MLPTYIDVAVDDPSKIIKISSEPLITLGRPGCFDDSGITLGSLVDLGDRVLIFYTGWKRRRVVSFELSIGILLWDKRQNSFSRMYDGPILSQDPSHPILVGGPFVLKDINRFQMWYCSGTEWRFPENHPEPIYTVFHGDSTDGVSWKPSGKIVIPYSYDGEVISAPWVERCRGSYVMWYSTRGHASILEKRYKIGIAYSDDGLSWNRSDDQSGIERSVEGWDSEMICYPAIYAHDEVLYMFYSGNQVGLGGLGYAVTNNFLR